MNEQDETLVVVTGPDTRPSQFRTFELETHECCVGHFNDHYVFVVRRFQGIEHEPDLRAVPLEKWYMWGDGPLAVFKAREAAVITCELLRSFVFVSEKGSKMPMVGYMVLYDDYFAIHRWGQDVSRLPDHSDYYYSRPCRALKVELLDDSKFTVYPVLVDEAVLAKCDRRMFRLGAWQGEVWDKSAGLIPDSDIDYGAIRLHPRTSKTYHPLSQSLTDYDRERLLTSHLFTYWNEHDYTLKMRTADWHDATKLPVFPSEQTIRNKQVDSGCLNPPRSLAERTFKSLKHQVKKHISRSVEDGPFDIYLGNAHRLLTILYPEEFGEAHNSIEDGPSQWHLSSVFHY